MAGYRARISGPLLDRFDLQIEVPPLPPRDLRDARPGEPTAKVAARVAAARRHQEARLAGSPCGCNAALPPEALRRHAVIDREGRTILDLAIRRLGLSARAHDGILRVARTIADLEGGGPIRAAHVAEAAQYRALDRDRPGPD